MMADAAIDIEMVKDIVDGICKQAVIIPLEHAIQLVREIERTDTLLPMVDPTGWIKIRDTLPGHLRAAKAFLEFRRELENLKERG